MADAFFLNEQQKQAVDLARSGHNFILLGCAGTGKSVTIATIVRKLRGEGKVVALTCSTGIACQIYDADLQASTLHQFAGLLDGRFDPTEIRNIVANSVKNESVLRRIQGVDTLVVDECSMISKKTFQSLLSVLSLKNKEQLTGGIQLIFSGDMHQLRPVKNSDYFDDGKYCFEDNTFRNVFPHRIVLNDIIRQSDPLLIQSIRDVSSGGKLKEETVEFIKTLDRELPHCNQQLYKLFAKNDLVDDCNRSEILDMPGHLYELNSTDTGDQNKLQKLVVPKVLWMKVGMPVILLRNLSERLVNGLCGEVVDISEDGITINFESLRKITQVQKYNFEVFSPQENCVVACREQYPVKPAFGLTIHKAQGMTLERVEVDCKQIFQPGQLGVAMSRSKTTNGLRVINFHPKVCIQQPMEVTLFMDEASECLLGDKTCCVNQVRKVEDNNLAIFTPRDMRDILFTATDESQDNEVISSEVFDEDFDNLIKSLDLQDEETQNFRLPEDFKTCEIIQTFKHEIELSPTQFNINTIVDGLNERKMDIFFKKEFLVISKLLEDLHISEPRAVKSKELVLFYKGIVKHLSSLEYKMSCLSLFNETFSADHMRVCFRAHLAVRKHLLKQQTILYASENCILRQRYVTEPSKAKIRYVGGYCIAKVMHSYWKKKNNHCFKTNKESQEIFDDCKYALALLNSIKEDDTYSSIVTDHPSSLVDIRRKQNVSRSLTNINDEMYIFFTELTKFALSKLSSSNLNIFGQDLFNVCISDTLLNLTLKGFFSEAVLRNLSDDSTYELTLIQNHDKQATYVGKLYETVIKKYMMVFFNQFRKDLKSAFRVEKTMAHRKQIQVSKLKHQKSAENISTTYTPIASTSTAPDTTTQEQACSLSQSARTEQTKTASQSKKGPLRGKRTKKVAEKHSYLNEAGEMIWICPTCGVEDDGAEKMIGCDMCDEWFHWDCIGIADEPGEEDWYCPACEKKRKRRKSYS